MMGVNEWESERDSHMSGTRRTGFVIDQSRLTPGVTTPMPAAFAAAPSAELKANII